MTTSTAIQAKCQNSSRPANIIALVCRLLYSMQGRQKGHQERMVPRMVHKPYVSPRFTSLKRLVPAPTATPYSILPAPPLARVDQMLLICGSYSLSVFCRAWAPHAVLRRIIGLGPMFGSCSNLFSETCLKLAETE